VVELPPIHPPLADPSAGPINPPLVVGARELAALLRVGLRTVRSMDAAGRLPKPIRIGHSVRWSLEEIRDWVAAGAPKRDEWESRRKAGFRN
jgi:predicted DNA-binding transcriptional regulator AlpA